MKYFTNIRNTYPQLWRSNHDTPFANGVLIHASPTGNCQMSSVVCFATILAQCNQQEIIKICEEIRMITSGVKMIFVDVRDLAAYRNKIKKIFAKGIVMEQKYKSTNNSKMRTYILDLSIFE